MSELERHASFQASWSAASWEADLERWSAFLAERGVGWTPDASSRQFFERVANAAHPRAADVASVRLAKLGDDALAAKGDERRVLKLVGSGALYLLSPADRQALEREGHRFESPAGAPLRNLATIPITLGAYFVTQFVCTRAGLDPNVAWIVALVAYVLTVRVVRGRWPLQRG